MMKRIATTVRCVPRFGYENTEVRIVDLDLPHDVHDVDERELHEALSFWFSSRGIADAVYDVRIDDDGYFAIVNDEAYRQRWGTPLL